jgi:hypothetical protein
VVWWWSTLEIWRGILDCLEKMGRRGLVSCWWSSVEVETYEETFAIEDRRLSFSRTESLCYLLKWLTVE